MKIFADPFLRMLGSRWEYMMRIDFPLTDVKFSSSIARDAGHNSKQNKKHGISFLKHEKLVVHGQENRDY